MDKQNNIFITLSPYYCKHWCPKCRDYTWEAWREETTPTYDRFRRLRSCSVCGRESWGTEWMPRDPEQGKTFIADIERRYNNYLKWLGEDGIRMHNKHFYELPKSVFEM